MPPSSANSRTPRTAFVDGLQAIAPQLLGIVPFGLVIGVTASSAAIGTGLAASTSFLIFGGASQLAVLELTNEGAAAIVVILTGIVINVRHVMYSAVLAEPFRAFPTQWRFGLPYLLTDQAFAVSVTRYIDVEDPVYRRWYFFGAGFALWFPWQVATAIGVLLGAEVPESWSLGFAVPLVFLVLLILAVKDRPGLVAAIVGGTTAVLARDVSYHLGLLVAAAAGVAAGVVVDRLRERTGR